MRSTQRTPTTYPLFSPATGATREQARQVSSRNVGQRYVQIVQALTDGPSCIFEIAQRLGCFDHQISGRFGELERQGLIRKTGQRRIKPTTGCPAEVYEIVRPQPATSSMVESV